MTFPPVICFSLASFRNQKAKHKLQEWFVVVVVVVALGYLVPKTWLAIT